MKEETSEVLYLQDQKTFEKTVKILSEDKVMVLPCDTIYGLCAKVGTGEKNLKAVKPREASKPFLVLATIEQAKELCDVPSDIAETWPAPLTAVLNCKKGGTLAVRVPSDPFLQALMTSLDSPIYSTSVNETGQLSLTNIMDIILTYKDRVPAFVVDTDLQGSIPSTLIDATTPTYKLLRAGKFDARNLLNK
jgi:L-threonylcarbamoyladenylate synthase